jgi:membrane protein YqaA with SNARE-associated domain
VPDVSFWIAAFSCFGLAVLSAIVPWIAAEAIVAGLPAVAPTRSALVLLVIVAVAGQMCGKAIVYWTSRRGTRAPSAAVAARLARWRVRFERRRWTPAVCVLASSLIGIPPFFLVTMIAGALRMRFAAFLALGAAGRLIRFGGLAAGIAWFGR